MRPRKTVVWLTVLIANALCNYDCVLRLIGRFGWFKCVFLVYPSRRRLAATEIAQCLMDRYRWDPAIGGVFHQGRRWGLMFAVTAAEPELIDPRNAERLCGLVQRMERIRELLRADRSALAGVLPSVLASRGMEGRGLEAEAAAECVVQAIEAVRRQERLQSAPVLLLGARGYVGSRVAARVAGPDVWALDRVADTASELPASARGQRALLVNLTWANVLETYVEQMWEGLVVLNEVYPPPSRTSVQAMGNRGTQVYHVAGVVGTAYPPFSDAYAGGVPCCAAWVDDKLIVRIMRLH